MTDVRHYAVLALNICAWWLVSSAACAATPWEKYVAEPSPENARSVAAIQYSEPPGVRLGERTTTDIQMLAVQVYSADREAFRLTLRLIGATAPGADLEYLHEIAGRFLRQNPKAFLEDIAAAGHSKRCPGVDFAGIQYVDQEKARAYEISARRKALLSVNTKSLLAVRDACIAQLEHETSKGG